MFQIIIDNMGKMNIKLNTLTKGMQQLKRENIDLKNKLINQQDKIEQLKRKIRKSIIVKGIQDEEEENEKDMKTKLHAMIQKMGVEIDDKFFDAIRVEQFKAVILSTANNSNYLLNHIYKSV
ncbi:hypothetical protein FQA39_LY05288 [Lamprigera yunnana]|nr:hypothetical protein FQA39_LY05288 [Lamprigera yunnana]